MKMRLGGSFLLASVFTITEMAFTNTFRPAVFCSASSLSTETLAKLWRKKMQQPAATSFFIVKDYGLKIEIKGGRCKRCAPRLSKDFYEGIFPLRFIEIRTAETPRAQRFHGGDSTVLLRVAVPPWFYVFTGLQPDLITSYWDDE
jgi:hypothetical protein